VSIPRIAIVHYTCSPVIGGVEIVTEAHARLFADHGIPVVVVAGRGERFDPRVPVEIIPEIRASSMPATGFEKTKRVTVGRMSEILSGAEVCIVHNALTMHFNLPLTAALNEIAAEGRVGFVGWTHDIAAVNPWYADKIGSEYPWSLLRGPVTGGKYVTISELRRGELGALFRIDPAAIEVIPNGIYAERFAGMTDAGMRLFERHGLTEDDIVMLYPARIVRRKNIELAIRITRAVNARGRRAHLLVTGAPDPHNTDANEYFRSLEALTDELRLEDRVLFLGGIESDLLSDLYQLADLLLFPTKQEGFGIPVLEAGAAHLPVACSRIEPLTDIAGDGVCYLDLEDTPERMAKIIIDYLDWCDCEPLYERVMENYTWQAIYEKHLAPLVQSLRAESKGA
jgi:glycosyltransferase involved in cell wall biosynthesis